MDLKALNPTVLSPHLTSGRVDVGVICSCGSANGAGSGGSCLCGSASGGGQ